MGETCRILGCDRATIFTLDAVAKELVLSVAEGAKNIRVPLGQVSIAAQQHVNRHKLITRLLPSLPLPSSLT